MIKTDHSEYSRIFTDNHTIILYVGPLWPNGIGSIAELLQRRLDLYGRPSNASYAAFAIFVEQLNNMLMYSASKERIEYPDGSFSELPQGSVILGINEGSYYIKTENFVSEEDAKTLKENIDYLNGLEKKELLWNYKSKLRTCNMKTGSKGAGLGLIGIAWRAKSKIGYEFTPGDNNMQQFAMYVTV